jgi:hypothetical protein
MSCLSCSFFDRAHPVDKDRKLVLDWVNFKIADSALPR